MMRICRSHHHLWGLTQSAGRQLRNHWDEKMRARFKDGETLEIARAERPIVAAEEAAGISGATEVVGNSDGAG